MFFLQFYFLFLLSIILMWGIGLVVRSMLGIKQKLDYLSILYNTFIGILVFATLVAIFYTKGKTILVFNTVIGLFFYLYYKKYRNASELKDNENRISDKNNKFIVPINALIAATLVYTIFYIFYADGDNKVIIFPTSTGTYGDYLFYGSASYNLISTGIENKLANYILPPPYLAPYHYLELWLNGGIASITGLNHVSVLMLVTYPLFIFLIVMGMCFLFLYFVPLNLNYILPVIGVLLTFIIALPLYDLFYFLKDVNSIKEYFLKISQLSMFYYYSWMLHKISVIHLFLMISIILLVKNQKEYAYLVLLSLPINYTTTMPSIYGGLVLFVIYLFLIKRYVESKWLFIRVFTLSFFIFLFYYLFSSSEAGDIILLRKTTDDSFTSIFHSIFFNISYKIVLLIKLISALIITILTDHWYLLVFVYLGKKMIKQTVSKYHNIILLLLFTLFCGIITWALDKGFPEAMQFFMSIYAPLTNLISVILLLTLYKEINKFFFTLFFVTLSIYGIYTSGLYRVWNMVQHKDNLKTENINIIKQKLFPLSNKIGVYFQNMNNIPIHDGYPMLSGMVGTLLLYQNLFSDFYCTPLNMYEFNVNTIISDETKHQAKIYIKHSIFNRYIEKQKQENKFISIPQSQLDFIKEYNIKYMITDTSYVLPKHIDSLVKEKISLHNEFSLYLLK